MNDKKIDERTFEFAMKIVQVDKFLVDSKEFVLSEQLLRAGTSIGANVHEAQAAPGETKRSKIDMSVVCCCDCFI
ncbi:MAG: four helix bundle protein [Thermodesulfobacteriota bacterium]|nr:four helix bundle protein [Thermodesulfobacteriota bacterium]